MCAAMSTPCAAASEAGRCVTTLPIVREAIPRTVRLVSTARLRPPVLAALVAPDEIEDLRKSRARPAPASSPKGAEPKASTGMNSSTESPTRSSSTRRSPIRSRASRTASTRPAAPGTPRSRSRPACARSHGTWPTSWRNRANSRRRRLRGDVRQHGGRVRRPEGKAGATRASTPIRRSATRPATRSPIGAGAGAERHYLSVGAARRRDLHRRPPAARGAVGRARRPLPVRLVRAPDPVIDARFGVATGGRRRPIARPAETCRSIRSAGRHAASRRRASHAMDVVRRLPPLGREIARRHGVEVRAHLAVERLGVDLGVDRHRPVVARLGTLRVGAGRAEPPDRALERPLEPLATRRRRRTRR